MEGRFSGCLKFHQYYMALWSCNIGFKNEDDTDLGNKIVNVDFSIIPTPNDTKESLIRQIASSTYLDDIVIYNAAYSVKMFSHTNLKNVQRYCLGINLQVQ